MLLVHWQLKQPINRKFGWKKGLNFEHSLNRATPIYASQKLGRVYYSHSNGFRPNPQHYAKIRGNRPIFTPSVVLVQNNFCKFKFLYIFSFISDTWLVHQTHCKGRKYVWFGRYVIFSTKHFQGWKEFSDFFTLYSFSTAFMIRWHICPILWPYRKSRVELSKFDNYKNTTKSVMPRSLYVVVVG